MIRNYNRKKRIEHKKKNNFTTRMQGRLGIIFSLTCILFSVLLIRILYIQLKSGRKFEKIVLQQQEFQNRIIPYQRGNILDAQGTPMASSIDVYNVILDCKELNEHENLINSTKEVLLESFPEITKEKLNVIKDKPESRYQVLAKKVSYEEKVKFDNECKKRKEDKPKNNSVTGVWLEKEYIRQYPYNDLASSVIGFTSSDNQGLTGLEAYYNSTLNGVNGRSYGYVNGSNNIEGTVVDAKSGYSIQMSIDHNIQQTVEDVVKKYNNMRTDSIHKTGSISTTVVVMDPNSGKILALCDYPSYDLNHPRKLDHLYTEGQEKALSPEDKSDALNRLWNSVTVTNTFEPGSTFKPITVAAGLETGKLKLNDTFFCSGSIDINGDIVHCWKWEGHGQETIENALRDSCNVAIMKMGQKIGAKDFSQYQKLFGFNGRTGIDLPGEPNTSKLLYDEKQLERTINLSTNAFGQNFNITRMQMASAFCTVINGGKLYKPYLVTKVLDENRNVLKENSPIIMKNTISKETSDILRQYLRTVVTSGTGKKAQVPGYDIGGKTGTAEKIPRKLNNYVLSFEGFCPVDNPKVMTYVTVDTVNSPDQYNDSIAKDIFREVMEQILPYLNVEPMKEEVKAEDTKK